MGLFVVVVVAGLRGQSRGQLIVADDAVDADDDVSSSILDPAFSFF